MRCFRPARSPPPLPAAPSPPPSPPPPPPASDSSDYEDWWRRRNGGGASSSRNHHSPTSSRAHTSTTAAASSSSASTINLSHEYALAVHTHSYNEIWSKIFSPASSHHLDSSAHLISRVLHPDRAAVDSALSAFPPSAPLRPLAARYFDTSELISHLCLSLHRAVDETRSNYSPITLALDLLHHHPLSPAQCDFAFDRLRDFLLPNNPFPSPSTLHAFRAMRLSFSDLRPHLDRRLLSARRRHRLLRRGTRASAACLIASTAAIFIATLALAAHALTVLPAALLGIPTRDLLAAPRRRLRERIARLDNATRGAYVLNNDLDTIEQLVAGLHAAVESDKELVRLGIERGRGQCQLIEEVLRHLRSSQPRFLRQLKDLDEHVCLCFAAVNRARSLLLHHIYNTTATNGNHPINTAA